MKVKYNYSYLFILPLMVIMDNCDDPPTPPKCPLTDMMASKEIVERIRQEYGVPEKSLRLEQEEGEFYIALELEGKSYEINRDVQKSSTVDIKNKVDLQLTLLRDDACNELLQIELDHSLTYGEKRLQKRAVRNYYLDRCFEVINEDTKDEEGADPDDPPKGFEVVYCHPGIRKSISKGQLGLTMEWLPPRSRILLHFEPKHPLKADRSQNNIGVQRAFRLGLKDSLNYSRPLLPEGLQDRDLLVSVYDITTNEETLICRFNWMR